MRVAVDIDNTVQEWQGRWVELYTHWFDREVDPAVVDTWDALVTGTHFETAAEFFAWFDRAGGWNDLEYVPGAAGGLYQMQQLRIPFFFVTAREPEGQVPALKFANEWGTHVQFLNAKSKHLAKADLWIDDSPEVLANLADHGKTAIRFEQPWNHGAPATHSAATWPEIIEILKELQ